MVTELLISHSEVDAFARCEQQHKFAHGDKLAPIAKSDGLDRGSRNHLVVEAYYKTLLAGGSWNDAVEAANKNLATQLAEPNPPMELLGQIMELTPYFFEEDKKRIAQGWRVLAVEQEFRLKFPPMTLSTGDEVQITYPFQVDLIRLDPNGRTVVVDTKTVYNFYTLDEMALMPQVAKYVGALRAMDKPADGGYMSQMRWRKLKAPQSADKQRWEDLKLTDTKITNAFREHIKQMQRIAIYKMNKERWDKEVTKTLSLMVCKNCSFKLLCQLSLAGMDDTNTRMIEYQPNTYGYYSEAEDA